MMNVLWLASWYPNRLDLFNGDFIERHALAVSRYVKVTVILVVKDETIQKNTVEVTKTVSQNLTVYRVYYGSSGWPEPVEKMLSSKKYIKLQQEIFEQIIDESGLPDIVHVQVAMKAGIFAARLKRKYKIPYVVTEHWSGYYQISKPNIYDMGKLYLSLNRSVLRNAAILLPVTNDLGETIIRNFVQLPFTVIPNVVDTDLFFHKSQQPAIFQFIHPSYMNYPKNPEGILAACKIVQEGGYQFQLQMIGNRDETLMVLAAQLGTLNKTVFFETAIPYAAVAKRMQESSALLMFSRYENLPCIVLESLCCGLPVICSRVGGLPEVIDDKNGILVEKDNVQALAAAMIQMMESYATYDRKQISENASTLFNYDVVGKQYEAIYKKVLIQHQSNRL